MFGLLIPSDIVSYGVHSVHIFGLPQIRPHKTHIEFPGGDDQDFFSFKYSAFAFTYSPSSVLPFLIFLSFFFLLCFIFIYYLSSTSSSSSPSSPSSINSLQTQNEPPSNSNHVFQLYNSPTLFHSLVSLSSLPTTIYRHSVSHTDPLMVCNSDLEKITSVLPEFLCFCEFSDSPTTVYMKTAEKIALFYAEDRGGKILRNVFTFLSK